MLLALLIDSHWSVHTHCLQTPIRVFTLVTLLHRFTTEYSCFSWCSWAHDGVYTLVTKLTGSRRSDHAPHEHTVFSLVTQIICSRWSVHPRHTVEKHSGVFTLATQYYKGVFTLITLLTASSHGGAFTLTCQRSLPSIHSPAPQGRPLILNYD